MLPKAYRWVGEMEEISQFVGSGEGKIHEGLARTYERVEKSLNAGQGEAAGEDVRVLKKFAEDARRLLRRSRSESISKVVPHWCVYRSSLNTTYLSLYLLSVVRMNQIRYMNCHDYVSIRWNLKLLLWFGYLGIEHAHQIPIPVHLESCLSTVVSR